MAVRRLLSPKQVEAEFGISIERLHYWRKTRRGPEFIKLGHRSLRYDSAVLEKFIQRNTHTPSVRDTIEEKRVHL